MRIGIDLGGTKIEAAALGTDGEVVFRHRVPTPVGDYDATLKAICGLVAMAEQQLSSTGTVGVGAPGTISPNTGRIMNANSTILNGTALDHDLSQLLGRPIRIENDANCFALSESVDGAAAGHRVVFGIILGTGTGGGIVIDGKLLSGRNRIGGEWGHNPLPWPNPSELPGAPCFCGHSGCIETWLSGSGVVRSYEVLTGRIMAAKEIFKADREGDPAAQECLRLYRDRLARALASVIDLIDPDIIVLGGGISNEEQIYQGLNAAITRYAFSDGIVTPIVRAKHGDSSGVRGAAWLWPNE